MWSLKGHLTLSASFTSTNKLIIICLIGEGGGEEERGLGEVGGGITRCPAVGICSVAALKLLCNCFGYCTGIGWKLLGNCIRNALELPWNCPGIALEWPWNGPGIQLHLH